MATTVPLDKGLDAVIDDDHWNLVKDYRWYEYHGAARCEANQGGKTVHLRMHRLIMGARPGERVLHRDGNGLNNQKGNLVVVSAKQ